MQHLDYPDEYQEYMNHMKQRPGGSTPTRPAHQPPASGNGYRGQVGAHMPTIMSQALASGEGTSQPHELFFAFYGPHSAAT